jgi:sugar O-acyltransferase (sialic acid O-acetyltransferase NeuD family)
MAGKSCLQSDAGCSMKRVAIIGAGLLGQQIAHHIKDDQGYEPVGFFDDKANEMPIQDYGTVLGQVADVKRLYADGVFDLIIIGIGYKHFGYRWLCYEQLHKFVPFLTFVHSSCWVDKSAHIGEGSFLMAGTTIDDHVSIGENTFLQIGCSISHHSTVKENCFFGPNVTLAGCVTIGRDCFLGVSSVLIDSVHISSGVQTGAGTVVINSIGEAGLYVGVPARKIK